MPKALRYFVKGQHYHLTHRCHNRSFLFRFAKDRDMYREMLRQRLKVFRTPLLAYCITSNHVHLLVTARSETRISEFMESLEGDFAQQYNLRKKRNGAFWGGRFHAVAVEGGDYLWNCMNYIELNMVRAGVVEHPADWRWCSYGELTGLKQRYRVVNREQVARALGQHPHTDPFQQNYRSCIEQKIRADELTREAIWTERLAVGSESFVTDMASRVRNRRRLQARPAGSRGSKT
ncbi:MAG: transposase [Verrucomicrobia bacterium]|nr:transposase [Verrucomicrobiota bacterium]